VEGGDKGGDVSGKENSSFAPTLLSPKKREERFGGGVLGSGAGRSR